LPLGTRTPLPRPTLGRVRSGGPFVTPAGRPDVILHPLTGLLNTSTKAAPVVLPAPLTIAAPAGRATSGSHVWARLLDKAGARHIRVHDARHSCAPLMLRRGVPIACVSRQPGHSSIKAAGDRYGHVGPGADRHHVEALAEAIEGGATQADATPAQPTGLRGAKGAAQVADLVVPPG
jgi:hypothetical protein